MFIEERHQAILDIINSGGRISIGDIQEKFDVSVDSARRDLRILEEKGLLKRTHGGAIPIPQAGQYSPVKMKYFNAAEMENINENYDAIAKMAVKYIKPNDAVYITSGSIGYLMIKYLPEDIEFTVITNSIDNASVLRKFDNIQSYVIGGKMRPNGRIVDSFAQEFIRNMQFDVSFLTGAGITADFGVSNGTPETSAFQRIIAENSRKNIALFPSQKVGLKAFIKDVDISEFDILITDWDVVEDELLKFDKIGVQVVVAEKQC
jgi:DeoR family transcriptional regulator, fructose operon transcriptional repressor